MQCLRWAVGAFALLGSCTAIADEVALTRDTIVTTGTGTGKEPEKLDLLFVVDNSQAMASKQAAFRDGLPGLLQRLATGARFVGDPAAVSPIADLHIGVLSSDLGIPGVTSVQGCDADGGDNGRLQRSSECHGAVPRFLSFSPASATSVAELGADASCMASLGNQGCGVRQPLDAALKALTSRDYVAADGRVTGQNPFTFIATTDDGTRGRGDKENLGFLRPDSLLAIVVLTDGDDCSLRDTSFFEADTDLATHCAVHKDLLFDIKARFYDGLRALRQGRERDLVFAAIAGVPADLVDTAALETESRADYYADILTDPRMQQGPSCTRKLPDGSTAADAYPPRRIVELAQLFGENSALQSICQDDLGPALDAIASLIQAHMRNP